MALVAGQRELELLNQAQVFKIEDEPSALKAHEIWKECDSVYKQFEKEFKQLKRVHLDGIKLLESRFKEIAEPYRQMRDKVKQLILDWRAEEKRKADEEARKLLEAREAEVQAVSEATKQPVEIVSQYVPQPPPPKADPGRGMMTSQGAVRFRRVPKWKIVDYAAIPWEHKGVRLWALNEAEITRLRREAGENLQDAPAGIEFYYEETPY